MKTKRIIPCLDVKNGRVVKGVNFVGLRDAGDPVELASLYNEEGADELVLLDISATTEERATMIEVVERTAAAIQIPFAVGGGVSQVEHVERLLQAGANKVGMNSAAVRNPQLVADASRQFGAQAIVVAIDVKYDATSQRWEVYTHGGNASAQLEAVEWAKRVEQLGAGEILLTSMDADGTKDGYDVPLTKLIASAVTIPVVASGGAGTIEHFYEVLTEGEADAALAASIFHYKEVSIAEVKQFLQSKGVEVHK